MARPYDARADAPEASQIEIVRDVDDTDGVPSTTETTPTGSGSEPDDGGPAAPEAPPGPGTATPGAGAASAMADAVPDAAAPADEPTAGELTEVQPGRSPVDAAGTAPVPLPPSGGAEPVVGLPDVQPGRSPVGSDETAPTPLPPDPDPQPAVDSEAAPEPEPVVDPGPTAQPADGVTASPLVDEVASIREAVDRLAARVDELARLGARNAELVDRLHAENQKLRGGELSQAMAPFMRDVIRMHDVVVRLDGGDDATPGPSDLALMRPQLLEVLSRAGVDAFAVGRGEPFDASRHQGVGVVEATGEDAAPGTVASVLRCGFAWSDGRVLRPAEVTVYRSRAAGPAIQQPQGDE